MVAAATWTLLVSALVGLAAAAVYAYVGRLMAHRVVEHEDSRLAMRMFALWWYSLALLTTIGQGRKILVAFGVESLPLHTTLTYFTLLPLVLALWGLLYYLLFIYTGDRRLLVPLGLMHAGIFGYFTWVVAWLRPVGVSSTAWSAVLEYERDLSGPVLAITLALLLGPVIVGSFAYGTLFFRTRDRTSRYRIGLVAIAFLGWFGSSILGTALELNQLEYWPLASQLIGFGATLLVIAAYRPPTAVRRWLDVQPVALDHHHH